jgi:hypothetical protein
MHNYTVLIAGVFWLTIVSVWGIWEGFQRRYIAVITWGEQSGSHEMITPAPEYSLSIIGNCPHLEGLSVLQVSTVPYRKFQFLVIKIVSVFSFPRWSQNDCKENGLEQRTIKNGGRDTTLLLLVNSCAQVRSQCFFSKSSLSTSYRKA